jgi:hypothetical protein
MGGHVLRETTSRGLCGLVCPSRISERGGEGDCCVLCVFSMCVFIVFITAGPSTKMFTWGGGDMGLLLQYLIQSCSRGGVCP